MHYKLRAECSNDVMRFIENAHGHMEGFKMERDKRFPDVDFEFESNLNLEEIISILRLIDDGHVMVQTVKPTGEYTGRRNYDL